MGDPVDDVAVGVDAVEPLVLAHQPGPVVVALGVRLRDAHDGPVGGDLVRPRRVGAQRPAPRLDDGRQGGRGGEVDEGGDAAGVPPLAEEAAGADEDLGPAGLEERGDVGDPGARGPSGRARRDGAGARLDAKP